jgi:integrase
MARGKGEGSLFKDANGYWTVVVELPSRTGERRRKKVRRKSKAEALKILRDLLAERDRTGDMPTRVMTVEEWVNEWFTTIAAKKNRPKTLSTYRGLIDREILPALGTKKLDKLSTTDVRHMLHSITEKGLSSTTAAQVYRVLSVALSYAEKNGKVARNVAALVDSPRPAKPDLSALTLEQGIRVIETASTVPLGSLWAAVLFTGARQGELLGLERDRVGEVIDLSWQMQRLIWEHGCGGACGRKRGADCHKRKVTAAPDWVHRPLHGGMWLTRPKSEKGTRIVPLVEPLKSILKRHLAETADAYNPYNLVWFMPNGSPIDHSVQSRLWHELLKQAGVPDVRLHDGRHTTVDLLYEAGASEDTIRDIVGHSTREMTRAYKSRGNTKRHTETMLKLSALFSGQADGHSETSASIAS